MKLIFVGFVVNMTLFAIVACTTPSAQYSAVFEQRTVLREARLISHDTNPERLCTTVNALRSLGRTTAVECLRMYCSDPRQLSRSRDVHVICRLLFKEEGAWTVPMLGASLPETQFEYASRFPLFPVAVVDGVPFLLVEGYSVGGGGGDTGWKLLNERGQSEIIEAEWTIPTRSHAARAAKKLISSDEFKALYPTKRDLEEAESFVLRQVACLAE